MSARSTAAGACKKEKEKDKEKKKKTNDGNDDVKRDQKLQAILLADSFTKTFRVSYNYKINTRHAEFNFPSLFLCPICKK